MRGALAIVTNVRRDAVDAMAAKTNAVVAYGEIVWVRRPDAGVKFWGSQRCPRAMVSQKAGSPGRSRISRKAIAQGRPDASAKPVCSCAAFLLQLSHMRPRVRRAPGLPCALYSSRGTTKCKPSGASRRENVKPYLSTVIPGRCKASNYDAQLRI